MASKLKLKGAVVTGRNVNRFGYTRNWNAVQATGKTSESKYGGTMIEVETPKGTLSINQKSFTGVIKSGKTKVFFSGGRAVKSATPKVQQVVADVVLGKGHNVRVAKSKY